MKKRKGILTLSSLVFLLAIATSGVFINEPINKQNLETAVAASNPASGASYYATNEGDKYYQGIRNNKYATFVKLCDRIANTTFSKMRGTKQYEMYKKEESEFINKLYSLAFNEMFIYLRNL